MGRVPRARSPVRLSWRAPGELGAHHRERPPTKVGEVHRKRVEGGRRDRPPPRTRFECGDSTLACRADLEVTPGQHTARSVAGSAAARFFGKLLCPVYCSPLASFRSPAGAWGVKVGCLLPSLAGSTLLGTAVTREGTWHAMTALSREVEALGGDETHSSTRASVNACAVLFCLRSR